MFAVSHLGKSEKTAFAFGAALPIAFGAALLWQLSVTQYL
jgi:hypothetical protein